MATMIESTRRRGVRYITKTPTVQQENWLQQWLEKEFGFDNRLLFVVQDLKVYVTDTTNGAYGMFHIPHNKEYKEARVVLKDNIMKYLVKRALRGDF